MDEDINDAVVTARFDVNRFVNVKLEDISWTGTEFRASIRADSTLRIIRRV